MCKSVIIFFILFLTSPLTANAQSRCQNEPTGTQLPMPNSRITYLLCLNGSENIRSCSNGREFDPFDRRCIAVSTGVRSIPASRVPQDRCIGQADGTYLPDPTSRNRFVECQGGSSHIGDCQVGKNFNPTTSVCEPITRPLRNSPRPPITRVTTPRPGFARPTPPAPRGVQQNHLVPRNVIVPYKNIQKV